MIALCGAQAAGIAEGLEYAEVKNHAQLPLLKIESDYTISGSGQLLTRLQAFAESIGSSAENQSSPDTERKHKMGKGYFAGIDSWLHPGPGRHIRALRRRR